MAEKPKEKPKTIAAYIRAAPKAAQPRLREMLEALRQAAPKAEEGIKWGVPALSYDRILFTFAGFKNHVGLYPTPAAIKAFKKELAGYKTSAGTIQFPLDAPLPKALIKKIAAYRIRDAVENDARWM